jgi:uncharacterized protein with HEPN domain
MARDVGLIFEDIESSILGIMESIDARDYAAYRDTWIIKHGVQRGIEIISEASRHLPADLVERYPAVDWREIRGIGNILRHAYFQISDQLIWKIVQDDLPGLLAAIRDMKQFVRDADGRR